jgi:hypothetical protein
MMDSSSPLVLNIEKNLIEIEEVVNSVINNSNFQEVYFNDPEKIISLLHLHGSSLYQKLFLAIISNRKFSTYIVKYVISKLAESNQKQASSLAKSLSRFEGKRHEVLNECFVLVLDDLISKGLLSKRLFGREGMSNMLGMAGNVQVKYSHKLDITEADTHASFDVRSDARGAEADVAAEAEAEADTHASFDVRSDGTVKSVLERTLYSNSFVVALSIASELALLTQYIQIEYNG